MSQPNAKVNSTKRFVISNLPLTNQPINFGNVTVVKANATNSSKQCLAPWNLYPPRIAIAKQLQELQREYDILESEEAAEVAETLNDLAATTTVVKKKEQTQENSKRNNITSSVQTDLPALKRHPHSTTFAKQFDMFQQKYQALGNSRNIYKCNGNIITKVNNYLPCHHNNSAETPHLHSFKSNPNDISYHAYNELQSFEAGTTEKCEDELYEDFIDFSLLTNTIESMQDYGNVANLTSSSAEVPNIFVETLPAMQRVIETSGDITNITRYIPVPKWPKGTHTVRTEMALSRNSFKTPQTSIQKNTLEKRTTPLSRKPLSITQLLPLVQESISSTAYKKRCTFNRYLSKPFSSITDPYKNKNKFLRFLEPKLEEIDPQLEESYCHRFEQNMKQVCTTRSVATQTSQQSRSDCAMISFGKCFDYLISCFHCSLEFQIHQSHLFIKHMTEKHMPLLVQDSRISDNRQFNVVISRRQPQQQQEQQSVNDNKNINNDNNCNSDNEIHDIIAQVLDEDEQQALEEDLKKSTVYTQSTETANESTSEFTAEDWNDANLLEKDIFDSRTTISFRTTNSKIVMDLLCLMKCYPILWYKPRTPVEIYDSACFELASKINKRWCLKVLNMEMCNIIKRIKCWYRRILKTGNYKLEFHAYFMKCTEFLPNQTKSSSACTVACQHCADLFYDEMDLQLHMHLIHRIGDLPRKCAQCENGMGWQEARHECKHSEVQTFFCQHCNLGFFGKRWLHLHSLKHRVPNVPAEQERICNVCDKKFATAANLRVHTMLHLPKQHRCKLCGRQFHRTTDYNVHMCRHRNEKNFVCDICGSRHFSSSTLNCHIRKAHTLRGKPRNCTVCGKVFYGDSGLFYHLRRKHLVREGTIEELSKFETTRNTRRKYTYVTDSKTDKRYLQCDDCGKLYRDMTCMRNHRMRVHGYQWPLKKISISGEKNSVKQEWHNDDESMETDLQQKTEVNVKNDVNGEDNNDEDVFIKNEQKQETLQCIMVHNTEELEFAEDVIIEEEIEVEVVDEKPIFLHDHIVKDSEMQRQHTKIENYNFSLNFQ